MQNRNSESDKKTEKYFTYMCTAEGITCILLYLVAMPMKYIFDSFHLMIPVGILHGIFFTLYLFYAIPARKVYNWDEEDFVIVLLASLFPFATFWIERKYAKQNREE